MKNIKPSDIKLLREVASGQGHWRHGIATLRNFGLVDDDGLYRVRINTKGLYALRNIIPGRVAQINRNYHLPHLWGSVCVVEDIVLQTIDTDGEDRYGYPLLRSRQKAVAIVRIAQRSGEWMVYDPEALDGLPDIQGTISRF